MGNTTPRVASSAYTIEITKYFTEVEWNELTLALGQPLSSEIRNVISHLTDDYLNFRRHEGEKIPTVKSVCKKIELIRKNADGIISELAINNSDIAAHNTPSARAAQWIRDSQEGDTAFITEVQAVLRRLIISCDQALESRPRARGYGYQAGDAWKLVVQAMHDTLFPERSPGKGIGNNAYPMSPFVRFIDAWQNLLPGDARKNSAETKPDALQKAVNSAIKGKRTARDK